MPGVFLGSISFSEDVFNGVWFDSRDLSTAGLETRSHDSGCEKRQRRKLGAIP